MKGGGASGPEGGHLVLTQTLHAVTLLCGYFGVDYYNIIEGPSNGLELLQFFTEALEQRYENGNSR